MSNLITSMELLRCEVGVEEGVVFEVVVMNMGVSAISLPLQRFSENMELVSLTVADSQGASIEPIEYKRIRPEEIPGLEVIEAGGKKSFNLTGRVEEKTPGVFALMFPRATYRMERNRRYMIGINWGDFNAEPVPFCLP